MRRISITLLFSLFISTASVFGQTLSLKDKYEAGKEIVADLSRIVNPKGIQENYKTEIGGINQWVYVRGQDRDNPLILFLHGGPASPMAPLAWTFQRPLEEYFTVVNYDQRAAGRTFLETAPDKLEGTIKIDRYVDDAVELAEYLAKRYDKKKIILVGHSWGTIIGLKAAIKRPDLFAAYVGIGQVISSPDNERIGYEYAVEQTEKNNNEIGIKELKSIAPYPGKQPLTRERIVIARKWSQFYGGLSAFRSESKYFFYAPFLSPDYSIADVDAIDAGNRFSLGRLLDEFLAVDYKNIRTFPIPVVMMMGRHDFSTPSEPTNEWLKKVKAPYKKGIWFENSAHLIPFEEPGKMFLTMIETVRPLAMKNRR